MEIHPSLWVRRRQLSFHAERQHWGRSPPPSNPSAPQTEVSFVPAALRDSVKKLTLLLACSGLKRCIGIAALPLLASGASLICRQTCVWSRFYNAFFQSLRRYGNDMHIDSVFAIVVIGCQLIMCLSKTNMYVNGQIHTHSHTHNLS